MQNGVDPLLGMKPIRVTLDFSESREPTESDAQALMALLFGDCGTGEMVNLSDGISDDRHAA